MHLVVVLLNRPDQPDKAIGRMRELGFSDPLVLRARSTAAALSAEVPVFAGLKSLALGADDDALILLTLSSQASAVEMERLVARLQLEMDADQPPSGRVLAVPVIAVEPQAVPA